MILVGTCEAKMGMHIFTYPDEIRTLICTTDLIESFNRCLRKVTKNHPIFPSEEVLSKGFFLGIRRLQKKNGLPGCVVGV